MYTILVTGSRGFIGSHLAASLLADGHTVVEADRAMGIDLCNPDVVMSLPDVDYVVHLAAHNGTKHFYNRPFSVIRDNILPTQYLLERYAADVTRFVFAGSCESYAGAVDYFDYPVPTDEQVPLVITDVTNPRWSYGGSKLLNELQVTAAWEQLSQEYAIIRYHNVYGPGQRDHFIPEFYSRAKEGDLVLHGWDNTRSFMYVSDAVRVTKEIMFGLQARNEIINVGVNDEVYIKDVAELILEVAGIGGMIKLMPAPDGSVKRRCADLTKLQKLCNLDNQVELKEGIRLTLESL